MLLSPSLRLNSTKHLCGRYKTHVLEETVLVSTEHLCQGELKLRYSGGLWCRGGQVNQKLEDTISDKGGVARDQVNWYFPAFY